VAFDYDHAAVGPGPLSGEHRGHATGFVRDGQTFLQKVEMLYKEPIQAPLFPTRCHIISTNQPIVSWDSKRK
jgi:hypothetical protein